MLRPLSGARRHAYAASVGFTGGACVGLVGWGGAQFIIPGMTHSLMGLSQLASTGVSLVSLSVSTCSSAAKFVMDDSANLQVAAMMAVPSIVTARFGAKLAARLSDDVLQLAFNAASCLLIPTHFLVQRSASLRQPDVDSTQAQRTVSGQPGELSVASAMGHCAFGCASGLISAIMGVGGLPLTMSYLTAFTSLPHHLVQGTAVLAVAPSAITSAVGRISVIPPVTAAAVTTGAMGGATLGASVALRTTEERLRELYMLSLVVLGGRSVLAAGRNLRSIWARHRHGPA